MWIRSLGQEDPLEEGLATHSSILAWRIPWTEDPGGLQSIGSQRVGHDLSDLSCMQCVFYTTAFLQKSLRVAGLHSHKNRTRPAVNLLY